MKNAKNKSIVPFLQQGHSCVYNLQEQLGVSGMQTIQWFQQGW